MFRYFFLTSLLLGGCSFLQSTGCALEQTAASAAAAGIMSICSCSDQAQVAQWAIGKIPANIQDKICPKSGKAEGVIGSVVCAPVINLIAAGGCAQISSCSAANPNSAAVAKAVALCQGAI